MARVRPNRVQVLGRLTIANYAARPAAEWGAEYARFLKSLGAGHLSATVLLPRREVIVRQIALPGRGRQGPGRRDPASDRFAAPLRRRRGRVGLVAARRAERCWWGSRGATTVERYFQLFTEAGIAVAVLHVFGGGAARRDPAERGRRPRRGFRGAGPSDRAGWRSTARARRGRYSPRNSICRRSARRRWRSRNCACRPDTAPVPLEDVLPKPAVNPVENDLSRNALPYATALAGACPRLAPAANVLPAEQQTLLGHAAMFIPTVVLARPAAAGGGGRSATPGTPSTVPEEDSRRRSRALEPHARSARRRSTARSRNTRAAPDCSTSFRGQTRKPTWTRSTN